jgi:hypothetical protein
MPAKGKRKGAGRHILNIGENRHSLARKNCRKTKPYAQIGRFAAFAPFGTAYAKLAASAGETQRPTIRTKMRTKTMINLRTFATPIVNAAAASALSLALISGTVTTPANTAPAAAPVAASMEYAA